MTESNISYHRLPGRSRKQFGLFSPFPQSLWLGEDHLLLITRHYYGEACKRFYLNDLQALEVRKTASGRGLTLWLSTFMILLLAGAASTFLGGRDGLYFSLIPLVPLLLLMLPLGIHLASGPTCVFRLHTAVQVIDIECLRRLRTARKVVQILTPLIEAVQGPLTETTLAEPPSTIPAEASGLFRPPAALHNDNGKMHFYCFLSFLVVSLSGFADLLFIHPIKNLFDGLLLVALIIFVAQSFARQHTRYVPRALRRALLWGTLVTALHILLTGIYAMVVGVGVAVSNSGKTANVANIFTDPGIRTDPVFMSIQGGAGTLLLLIGLYGLLAYRRWQAELAGGITPTEAIPSDQPQSQD